MGQIKMFLLKYKKSVAYALNILCILAAFVLAFALRFDFQIPTVHWNTILLLSLPLLLVKLLTFRMTGAFAGWWRYVSLADVAGIFRANLIASAFFALLVAVTIRLDNVPRSILLLDAILCFLLICGIRFVTRAFREDYLNFFGRRKGDRKNILIVGAGQAGQAIVREIRLNRELRKAVVGFIDDDPDKLGSSLQGVPVLGATEQLPQLCRRYAIDKILIAIPSATGRQMRKIVERCKGTGVLFMTLPGVGELLEGKVSVSQIREVDVQDLLGRKPVRLDVAKIDAMIRGRKILVTGAAGSIGSEICRQVASFGAKELFLYEHAESPLFQLELELSESFPDVRLHAIVGDVRDAARVNNAFERHLPDVVFHAAAYKHVPMMEKNPAEGAKTNVFGTRNVANAADRYGCESFVMVSTDKAVNPTNIMGASKRAAELYVQALSTISKTRFETVRFGNVLGSAGSVVPTFKQQIKNGGPVRVTHPDITRFFMTIPEATQLVLQAGTMGSGGEIFLLDMGESVKIVHLAEELIRLSGFRPYEDIDISFTGLRPGEKLYEELLLAGEGVRPTAHEKIMVAAAAECDRELLLVKLEELYQCVRVMDKLGVRCKLMEIVPEFRSPEEVNCVAHLHKVATTGATSNRLAADKL
ncbi:MAG TPA: nucleoside-diphosphate sugar epimerase/dehydratase [Geopsychrobacteraceae bacterium]